MQPNKYAENMFENVFETRFLFENLFNMCANGLYIVSLAYNVNNKWTITILNFVLTIYDFYDPHEYYSLLFYFAFRVQTTAEV